FHSFVSSFGFATTSLKILNAELKFFFNTDKLAKLPSDVAPVARLPPRSSIAVQICTALRVPAPSSSILAVIQARPWLPMGSDADPIGIASVTATSGNAGRGSNHTVSPFAAVNTCGAGGSKAFAAGSVGFAPRGSTTGEAGAVTPRTAFAGSGRAGGGRCSSQPIITNVLAKKTAE